MYFYCCKRYYFNYIGNYFQMESYTLNHTWAGPKVWEDLNGQKSLRQVQKCRF